MAAQVDPLRLINYILRPARSQIQLASQQFMACEAISMRLSKDRLSDKSYRPYLARASAMQVLR
jgi:hypothetical protein